MSNFERVIVTCNNDYEVTFAIDHSKINEAQWHQLNNFWIDAEDRLDEADGNVMTAVLVHLAKHCMCLQVTHDYNSYGVMSAFDCEKGEGQEGWPKMDGSQGILIQHCEPFEFVVDPDCDVTSKAIDAMPKLPRPSEEWL
ncbi:DUF2528 family protein [Pseudoalteromonas rubra]|uniref:DUF2528 family protein n=1 Tax=Pseudoalteromonas rubra TaxID=43658 RepID=UPI0005F9E38A|nr:DUF2528 family protein [Pseudoalteromonas rubra]